MEQRQPPHLPDLLLPEKKAGGEEQELVLCRHDKAADWPPVITRIDNNLSLAWLVCNFSPLFQ